MGRGLWGNARARYIIDDVRQAGDIFIRVKKLNSWAKLCLINYRPG